MSDEPTTPEFRVTLSPHQRWPRKAVREELVTSANFILPTLLSHLAAPLPLDGSHRIEIRLGAEGDDPRYHKDGEEAVVYQPAFDVAAWQEADDEASDLLMLEAVGGIVDRLAHAFRGDRRGVKNALKQAARDGFDGWRRGEAAPSLTQAA